MTKPLSVLEFFKEFPDDETCLEHLMQTRYGNPLKCPKCGKHGKFSKIKKMPAYQCAWCGHHIHPMAGTPFESSRTPLQKWFYAIYLFTTSRHGVPAKELQRQLSVTYKTAWRMGHEIRKYMGKVDGDSGLGGHVEVDETYVGGKKKGVVGAASYKYKGIVFGMVERGGDIMTKVVPDVKNKTLLPIIVENIEQGTMISSDEMHTYKSLPRLGYQHGAVMHNIKQYVKGVHHTNTLENFWSRLKNSIRGTHIHVSRKHLPKYLAEFEYRYNMRSNPSLMFEKLLKAF